MGLARLTNIPVSVRLIREIHERLLDGVRGSDQTPGEFRVSQNWIGPPGCTLVDVSFIPSAPPIITVSRVQEITGLSFPAANSLIARFTEHDVLFEIIGKIKNRLFRYTPYI